MVAGGLRPRDGMRGAGDCRLPVSSGPPCADGAGRGCCGWVDGSGGRGGAACFRGDRHSSGSGISARRSLPAADLGSCASTTAARGAAARGRPAKAPPALSTAARRDSSSAPVAGLATGHCGTGGQLRCGSGGAGGPRGGVSVIKDANEAMPQLCDVSFTTDSQSELVSDRNDSVLIKTKLVFLIKSIDY